MKKVEQILKEVNTKTQEKVDWTRAWSQKYPILKEYPKQIDVKEYEEKVQNLLIDLMEKYKYTKLDAMLVLKDILYHVWKDKK